MFQALLGQGSQEGTTNALGIRQVLNSATLFRSEDPCLVQRAPGALFHLESGLRFDRDEDPMLLRATD
ncbi:hypothetical protein PF005_g31662, partial [Phytophthora fragariae]